MAVRIPKHLREKAEAAQREFNAPEAKATRQVTKAATAEQAATKRSRNEIFSSAAMPSYQVKELLRQGEPDTSSIDVDEKVSARREPTMSWATNDLAHFDLAESVHNSISHSVNSLFGMGGYNRASREVPSDAIAQEAFGRLHKARLHLDAHWDAHTGTGTYSEADPAAAHAHLNEATKLMSQAIDTYSQHPTADDGRQLGRSNARIPAANYSFDNAKKMLGALPGLYADHIQRTTGQSLGSPKKIDVVDDFPAGKQIATFMGTDPKKKAKVPRRKKVKKEIVQPTAEEVAQKKKDADEVLNTWLSTVEERPEAAQGAPKAESPARRVSKQITEPRIKGEVVPTAPSEQPNFAEENAPIKPGFNTSLTPLEKEHDMNVKNHRISLSNHHAHMAVVDIANGNSATPHLDKVDPEQRPKVFKRAERVQSSPNKTALIAEHLVKAAGHKAAAEAHFEKAVKTQRELREADNV